MPADWIKVRVLLGRDPKVISIADYLASDRAFMNWLTNPVQQHCDESAYEHCDRNVVCHVTVSLLVSVWGVARDRGERVGDDLVLSHCDISTIDAIVGVPGFGAAMGFVGWAEQVNNEDGICTVVFPKFFHEEVCPSERHKLQNAERQRRYRKRHGKRDTQDEVRDTHQDSVTGHDVTVTHRVEESRVEEKPPSMPPLRTKSGVTAHPLFERFWDAYPRKVAKQAAAKAFAAVSPDEATLCAMIESIAAQGLAARCLAGETRYVPHPASWLNGRRWTDSTTPPPAPPPPMPVGQRDIERAAKMNQLPTDAPTLEQVFNGHRTRIR